MSEEFSGKKKRKKKPEQVKMKSDQTDQNYELALKSIYEKLGVTTKCERNLLWNNPSSYLPGQKELLLPI